jgi:hypothetical protein
MPTHRPDQWFTTQAGQRDFLADLAPGSSLYAGGWGSGKTWAGARKLLLLHQRNQCPGLVVGPTYGDVWRILVPALQEAAASVHWPCKIVRSEPRHLLIGRYPIWLLSADAPERFAGFEVGHLWGDEAARFPTHDDPLLDAPTQMRSRLRHPAARTLHALYTTTHEGTHTWIYRDWFSAPKARHRAYHGRTAANTALDPSYLADRLATLPAGLVQQYLEGHAVDFAAHLAHPGFGPAHHLARDLDPTRPLHIGLDFNVSPLCWVAAHTGSTGGGLRDVGALNGDAGTRGGGIQSPGEATGTHGGTTAHQLITPSGGTAVHVVDEVVIENHATVEQAVHRAHAQGWGRCPAVHLHLDRSAQNRSTTSDPIAAIVDQTARALGWRTHLHCSGRNPPINARIGVLDALIQPHAGAPRLTVHPRCQRLIRELSSVGRLTSGGYDPGRNGEHGHILDALGYLVWDEARPGAGMSGGGY